MTAYLRRLENMEHSDTSFYEESHTKVNEAGELKILMKQNMNTRTRLLKYSTGEN